MGSIPKRLGWEDSRIVESLVLAQLMASKSNSQTIYNIIKWQSRKHKILWADSELKKESMNEFWQSGYNTVTSWFIVHLKTAKTVNLG